MIEKTFTKERYDIIVKQHENPNYLVKQTKYSVRISADKTIFVNDVIKQLNAKTILDYGCGHGTAFDSLRPDVEITNYDPFVPEFAKAPTGTFDVVVCFAVLNNVEHIYMSSVLKNIKNFTKGPALLSIVITDNPGAPTLEFYIEKIKEYFKILRQEQGEQYLSPIRQEKCFRVYLELEKL